MSIAHLIYGLEILTNRAYINCHYTYYRLFNRSLRDRIDRILELNEKDVNLPEGEQEEQALPGCTKYRKSGYYKYMLSRYLYCLKYIKNKTVLDCASGLGWGSFLISDYPEKLLSIDINDDALDFAGTKWKNDKLNFIQHSVLDLESLNQKFDVILGYELIEHLELSDGRLFVEQAGSALNKGGLLVLSSFLPVRPQKARKAEKANKYHLHIYTRDEMKSFLAESGFPKVHFLGDFMVVARKT